MLAGVVKSSSTKSSKGTANMPSLRPIVLAAVVSLWSAACAADDADTPCLCFGSPCTLPCPGPPAPPSTATPFPFCPTTPPGTPIPPFPWSQPSAPTTMFPQDPGFLASGTSIQPPAIAWLSLAFPLSAFLVFLQ
ncbi:hypothetical protein ABZP36_017107 [Zizania latifolia]